MKCPSCNETLLMTERNSIEIDYCPSCRGVWLDKGELDKMLEYAENKFANNQPSFPNNQPQFPNNQPPVGQQYPNKDQYYKKDDHYPKQGHYGQGQYGQKPYKKKSFLGDLFDFD